MKTLIVYATKTGFVDECVAKLEKKLNGDVEKVNLGRVRVPDLSCYDRVIIGGSIHAGRVQKSIINFSLKYIDQLKTKKPGLFLCCLTPPEKADHYFAENFPAELVSNARFKSIFGAAVYYERMNFIERFILKKITKRNESFSALNDENIDAFAKAMG